MLKMSAKPTRPASFEAIHAMKLQGASIQIMLPRGTKSIHSSGPRNPGSGVPGQKHPRAGARESKLRGTRKYKKWSNPGHGTSADGRTEASGFQAIGQPRHGGGREQTRVTRSKRVWAASQCTGPSAVTPLNSELLSSSFGASLPVLMKSNTHCDAYRY
jgi:hypothetical protein